MWDPPGAPPDEGQLTGKTGLSRAGGLAAQFGAGGWMTTMLPLYMPMPQV